MERANKMGITLGTFFLVFGLFLLWTIMMPTPSSSEISQRAILGGITFVITGLWVIYKSYRGKPTNEFFTPTGKETVKSIFLPLFPWEGPVIPTKIIFIILFLCILLLIALIIFYVLWGNNL